MIIVSVPDRLVRDPATNRVVDTAGIEVDELSPYWARLLIDGDVKEATKAKAAKIEEQHK